MTELLVGAIALLGYSLVSKRLSGSPVTAPMVFTTVGLLVGTGGLGWFDLELESEAVSILVEATLVLVLFTDAIRIDLRTLRRQAKLPFRLLGVGLPLTIGAGTLLAAVVFGDLGWAEAALLGAVLAPTDAALGQAVVTDSRLPVRIRQALNVESGLNDGIAVPVVTVFLALAAAEGSDGSAEWVRLAAEQIGFGVGAGVIAGCVGAWILKRQVDAGAVEGAFRQLATLSIAVAAFALAGEVGGNGFIAAFVAGLSFGQIAREQCEGIQDFTEDEAELLSAITFLLFGAALLGPVLDDLSWTIAVYAVGSLTVVRMVPVAIAMFGSGALVETRLFLGWFGPRGLASILFAIMVAEELTTPASETIFAVAAATIALSVVAHGASASWWAGRLGTRLAGGSDSMAETEEVEEMRTRF